MKQFSSFFLTALLYGAACLASGNALARGGSGGHSSGSHGGSVHVSGYTRKDGTYVAPYTRSAPGSDSGYKNSSGYSSQPVDSQYPSKTYSSDSNDSTDSQSLSKPDSDPSGDSLDRHPVTKPSPLPLNNSSRSSAKPLLQTGNTSSEFIFPQATCGDKPTESNDTWYPVFIDSGNLDNIRSQFCEDAISTVREDTKVKTVQVASFNNRDKALRFAQLVGGEVGKPTYPNNVEQNISLNEQKPSLKTTDTPTSVVITPTPISLVTPSSSTPSKPSSLPTTLSSSPSQENTDSGEFAWIFAGLLLMGVWITAQKFWRKNNRNIEQQTERPNAKKPSTVKETIGTITTLIVIGLMFKGCVSGSSKSAISSHSESACSQAQAKLDRAMERTSEWTQEHTVITKGNFDEATIVAASQAAAQKERDEACR